MASRLAALLPRLAALTVIWLLAAATVTFASGNPSPAERPAAKPAKKERQLLTVPDVRRQAYVFAKGILEDGGFAWRVEGDVRGYASNLVASQDPAPGTRVVDTGSPTVVLRLERNPGYPERGLPQNESPYAGDELVLASAAKPARAAPAAKPAKPAKPPAAAPKKAKKAEKGNAENKGDREEREPDFHVPGAPAEPLDEIPLADRARLLEKKLAAHPAPSNRIVKHWLYQHAWIVAGARFGWSGGADALRTLIRIDRDLQRRWGIGARSAAVARAALAQVERKTR